MEHCRTASTDDIPRLVDLARELRHELSGMRGGPLWAEKDAAPEPLDAAFAAWIADPAVLVLAGCIDDVIVGIGVVQVEPLRDGSRLGVVRELYVEEAARSVGVGEAMTDRIVEFCRAHDCIGVDAVALPGHRATKNFFEEQGFTARALTMHTRFDDTA